MQSSRQHIVFLTGAGISAESGLSTFRGMGGMWNNEDLVYMASAETLQNDTGKFLEFYNARRQRLAEVKPSKAHRIIAELEAQYDVTVVTQNVDNLHELAGSTKVVHLHGELSKVCSSANTADERYIHEFPLTTPIKVGDDAGDGSQMRPFVVLFGEDVVNYPAAYDIVKTADIMVVIGTSLVVEPAASLIGCVRKGTPRFIIDPNDIPDCEAYGYQQFKATASEGMERLLKELEILEDYAEFEEWANETAMPPKEEGIPRFQELWLHRDKITTMVDANGYSVWDMRQSGQTIYVELCQHLNDDQQTALCCQFPFSADYDGEGSHGSIFSLYL